MDRQKTKTMLIVTIVSILGIAFVLYIQPSAKEAGYRMSFCNESYPSNISSWVGNNQKLEKGYIDCCREYIDVDHYIKSECKVFKYKKEG